MAAPSYTEITHEGRYGESPQPEWYLDAKLRWQFRAVRILECAWTDRAALIADLMTQAGGSYPHADGTEYAYARSIKPLGFGQTGGTATLISYDKAAVEVFYSTEGPRWINGTYIDESMAPQQFWVHPPGGKLYWSNDDLLTDEERTTPIPFLGWEWNLTLGRLLTLPTTSQSYFGTCNNAAKSCYYLGLQFATQTVLYGPPTISSHSEMGGGTRYTAHYSHAIRPHGWNKFWHSKTAAWEYLYLAKNATNIYYAYPVLW